MAGNDSFTKLLLHCDGADTSTTFTDASPSAKGNATVGANFQVDTAQSVFGGGSGLGDGLLDNLSYGDSDDWDFGTADFTIDWRERFASTALSVTFFHRGTDDFELRYEASVPDFRLGISGSLIKSASWTPSNDTWYHKAVTRSGTNLDFWVDGVKLGTTTTNSTDITFTSSLFICSLSSALQALNGWVDEIRWSKGVARWTTNFTPPTEEYSLDSALISRKLMMGIG